MPDTPVDPTPRDPYDPTIEARVSRLEADMRDVTVAVRGLEVTVAEIKVMLTATLPHLATKADVADLRTALRTELADKPGKAYLVTLLAVLITAYAAGLAALAILK